MQNVTRVLQQFSCEVKLVEALETKGRKRRQCKEGTTLASFLVYASSLAPVSPRKIQG